MVDGWEMNRWMVGWIVGGVDGWEMNRWMVGWITGGVDGWCDG